MDLAGRPRGDVVVPAVVAALAGSDVIRPVWRNQLGGLTFALGDDRYVKWQPAGTPIDLDAEIERMAWLAPLTPVPVVLDHGRDDSGPWVLTAALPGTSAVDERWIADPAPAVVAIAQGLRRFHDTVPVESCPFDWSAETRLAAAPDVVERPPPVDRLVVCHGDACAPNTLVDAGGRFTGHVDLGQAGVADRWADLAVASWSLDWNFGPGWEDMFFDAYGVDPDPERIDYYRLLWEC
jgi:kanamycin kinase